MNDERQITRGDMMKSREQGPQNQPGGIIYKLLRIFTVIKPGEALTIFLLGSNVFLLILSYAILKPLRSGLFLTSYSSEQKAYMHGIMAIVFIFFNKAFSRLASKVPRQKLITWVTLFFISNIVLFFILDQLGVPMATIGPIYFVWLGIFNIMIIAQFWGFANDLYNPEQGKRLFPMIMAAQNIGAAFGFSIAFFFVQKLGLYPMMLLAGGILIICIVLTNIVHRRELKIFVEKEKSKQDKKADDKDEAEKPLGKEGGFQLVFKSRYLLYIAFLILTLNLVNTTGEYIRDTVFKHKAEETIQVDMADFEKAKSEYLSKLESGFQAISGYLAIAIQLLLVSRLFSWIGIRGALFILPLISLGGNFFIASLGASFMVVQWAKIFENSTDYSLMNALRAALYLVTSREAKYKAKAVIDTFFVRAGDFLTGLFVFLGTTYLAFNPERFAKLNIFIILIWLVLCYLIVKQHKKISALKEQERHGVAR